MKIAVKSVLQIVGMLGLAALIVLFALQLMGLIDIAQVGVVVDIIVYPEVLSSEGVGSFVFTDLDHDEEHTTATEVACVIGQSIRKDFRKYGYGDERPDGLGNYRSLTPIEHKKTIVDKGTFRIKWNSNMNNFWAFEDLPAELQKDLMTEGVCSDTGKSWHCSTPYLDEECVSNAMSHLKVGDNFLCTGITNARIAAGGAIVHFGNDNCGGDKVVADGTDNCKSLCPGGDGQRDRIKKWRAPGGTGMKEYEDDTEWDTSKEWPPYQCRAGDCEPLYAWMLVWNNKKDKKHYEIDIGRIPDEIELGEVSSDALVDKLLQGGYEFRQIKSGFPFPELRTRYDATFSLSDEVTLTGLLTKLTDDLGKDWNVEIEQCWGAECYESEATKVSWRAAKNPVAGTFDAGKQCPKKVEAIKKVLVRTNIEEADKKLKTDHKYHVVMRWWRDTKDSGWKSPHCEGVGVACVACVEKTKDKCYVGIRWLASCKDVGGVNFADVREYTRYKDQTLVIVDLGPKEEAAPEEGVS